MGFNKVYKALLEIFPEVDHRALRAVAIEHSKDGHAAVEVVLTEIVPFLAKISRSPSSSSGNKSSPVVANPSGFALNYDGVLVETSDSEDEVQNATLLGDANAGDCNDDHVEVHGGAAYVEAVSSDESQEVNIISASTQPLDIAEGIVIASISTETSPGRFDEFLDAETVMTVEKDESQANLSAQHKMVSPESSGELAEFDLISTDSKNLEAYSSRFRESNEDTITDVDIKDLSLNTMFSRSNEICRAELLEGLVSDARNNKKTLFSAMESVISLMRKVELQEDASELAKEEASKGGLAILNTVDEIINMLQRAKEANSMRAGEVYGERAVLATEARELQTRLFGLSEERDKSLAILDEMHDALLSRLAEAEEKEKMAEKEKLEKEDVAHKLLAEQELIMEKVVQESDMLKNMEEENAKLQEFLEDRGHVVDSLQGEISVICQDVRVLKQKFDDGVKLSESLSSGQTSCRLASSFSSSKSVASDQLNEVADHPDSLEHLQKFDLSTTTNEQLRSAEQKGGDNKKALLEEGWEIFEDSDLA